MNGLFKALNDNTRRSILDLLKIKEMSADEFNAWRSIAKETSYKKFVSGYKDGQRLLDLALSVN